ncbi:MAG: hypothetical protein SGI89_01410 [bacterium]|nr:hypothetical protein [bacterium]
MKTIKNPIKKTLADIPRELNKGNIEEAIKDYKILLQDIPLKIEESNLLDLLIKLKRSEIGKGPYAHVSIFEAANRIMTDLVILFGVKKLLSGEFPKLTMFTNFTVEFGNENKNAHDILSKAKGKKLAGEAFNVAPSFYNGKKSKTIKKLLESTQNADHLILLCNADSHLSINTGRSENNGIEIIKVDVALDEDSNSTNIPFAK